MHATVLGARYGNLIARLQVADRLPKILHGPKGFLPYTVNDFAFLDAGLLRGAALGDLGDYHPGRAFRHLKTEVPVRLILDALSQGPHFLTQFLALLAQLTHLFLQSLKVIFQAVEFLLLVGAATTRKDASDGENDKKEKNRAH